MTVFWNDRFRYRFSFSELFNNFLVILQAHVRLLYRQRIVVVQAHLKGEERGINADVGKEDDGTSTGKYMPKRPSCGRASN